MNNIYKNTKITKQSMPQTTILFDLDDTLVNTYDTAMKRINKLSEMHEIKKSDKKTILDLIKNPERTRILSKKYSQAKEIFETYEKLRETIHVKPLAEINDLFSKLEEKFNLGILTNNTLEKTLFKLSKCGVQEGKLNGRLYCSNDIKHLKPDPRCFNVLPEEIRKNKLIYVGDSIIDYETAIKAKISFIGVTTGQTSKEEFLKAGLEEDRILNNVRDVEKIIYEL
jgi:HAD superfamily hydrolase (TIGR01549 family)